MNLLDANDAPGAYPRSWYAETATHLPPCPPLEGEVRADVAVVGGGYTGLSAALHLARAGRRVVLIEAQRLGFGASGRNGGQVSSGQRIEVDVLEARHGKAKARALWDMGEDAKALVKDLVARHGIDCDLTPGIVHADWRARDVPHTHRLAEKLAREYDYPHVEPLDRPAIRALIGSPAYQGGAHDRGAAHLHPMRFALGLARAAQAAGASLHEGSRALAMVQRDKGVEIATEGGRLVAAQAVLACNGYLGGLCPAVARRVMPINSFIVATEPLGARAAEVLTEPVAVADSRFVVNYFRLTPDGRLLFGGGESYGYRFPADIAATVRKPMREVFPQLADVKITHAWGGTLAITRTRLPNFARIGRHVLSASGYSGVGVALAALAGRAMAEALNGQSARFDLLADLPPPPFPGGTASRSPLLALAMSWFALRDRLGL